MSDFGPPVPPPEYVYEPFRPKLSDPLRSRPTQYAPPSRDVGEATLDYYRGLEEQAAGRDRMSLLRGTGTSSRQIGSFALSKYLLLAALSPFEVASALVQLQWLPSDATLQRLHMQRRIAQSSDGDSNTADEAEQSPDEFDQYLSDRSFDSDDPEYYDPRRRPGPRSPHIKSPALSAPVTKSRALTTEISGYLAESDPYDEATRPTYQLYPVQSGSLSMMKAIFRHDDEGLMSLWKGQATHWAAVVAHEYLQPALEGYMNDSFGLYDDTIPLHHLDAAFPNFATMVGSHLLAGWLLSPLELVRTRMIAQTSHAQHRRYAHPVQALSDIVTTEHGGSIVSLYTSPSLLVPTLIVHTVHPILRHATPLIIDRCCGVTLTDAPTKYALLELAVNAAGLIILRPVETIRRRLQVQAMGGGRELDTCVAVGRKYHGFWDCFYRIVTEEGGRRTKRPAKKRQLRKRANSTPLGGHMDSDSTDMTLVAVEQPITWWNSWGVEGLYRGFWTHLAQDAAKCLVRLTTSIPDELEEW